MTKHTKNYRKFVATAATAILIATAIVPVASADVSSSATNFTDVSGNYKTPVDYLYNNGIINGLSATQFGTSRDIQRVDVAVMIAKALFSEEELNNAEASGFTDVPARAVKHINALKEQGFINGKTTTKFGSGDPITRGEAALMLAKAYGIEGDIESVDFSDVAPRYKEAVAALVDNDITKGKGDNKFGTADAITRGELAIFLYKLETLEVEEVVEGLEVVIIESISENGVNITIKAAKEADEKATVEVKNAQGVVVPVKPTIIEKGDTELTIEFVEKVKAADLDGVWSINGVTYSFTAIKQLKAIQEAAKVTPLNELNLLVVLGDASIKNLDANRAVAYADALKADESEVITLVDVQEIINEVNVAAITEAEKVAAAKAIKEATNQTQLLDALAKFERVNKDWIVGYDTDLRGKNLDFDNIQKAVNALNDAEINKSLIKAQAALDSKLVTKTKGLVEDYMAIDPEDAEDTSKADLLEVLELHQAVITVNEANTNEKLSVAVATLAELTEDFDAETVHHSLLKDYTAAIAAETVVTKKNTAALLQNIVTTVNEKVTATTLENINKATANTTDAEFLKLLQNEALGLEGVVAGYIKDYKEVILVAIVVSKSEPVDPNVEPEPLTKEDIQPLIERVNLAQKDATKLATINQAQTATDMRSALIAASNDKAEDAYLNLSSQAKLEVADLVLTVKDEEFENLSAALTAVETAIGERTTFIAAVNQATTITGMQDALKVEVVFSEFVKLSSANQIEKAEGVLNILTELKAKEPASAFTTITQIKAAASL